jgi:ABC-type hemin transport system substrate-binding protein
MKSPELLALCTLSLALSAMALAETPIKSVDEAGNVTYSDKPLENAVSTTVVPVDPAPDPERVEEARKQVDKIREQADAAEKARKEAEAERRKKEEAAAQLKASQPEVVIIQEDHGGYPVYNNPPLITPPARPRPPAGSKPDHPAYRPPGSRPPTILPVPKPR